MKTLLSRQFTKIAILRSCKYLGVFCLSRLLVRRKLLILCYHGFELTDEAKFRPRLFMPPDVFANRLEAIRRRRHPVLPLDEALKHLKAGTLPANTVCLTIDDGFYSVEPCAAPSLKRNGFPATLYVTSYYVQKGTPIFRLVVQYMFWKTAEEQLDVSSQPWGPKMPVDLSNVDKKERALWHIIEYGENQCNEPERQTISATLGRYLHVDYAAIRAARSLTLLSPEQIANLKQFEIDIQLHTHRHRLPIDDETGVRTEITENSRYLEHIVGGTLQHFCYPSGIWDRCQWQWLEDVGIQSATTCDPCFNASDTPALGLYRVVDGTDITQIEFEAELSGLSELFRIIKGRRKKLDLARKESTRTVP